MVNERGMKEDMVLGWRRNCSMFKCYGIESVERKKDGAGDWGGLLTMGPNTELEELSLVRRMGCLFL